MTSRRAESKQRGAWRRAGLVHALLGAAAALLLLGSDRAPEHPVGFVEGFAEGFAGLSGEAAVANWRDEPVTLWGCRDPFSIEEQLDGVWVPAPAPGFQPVACDAPLWLEPGEEVTLQFDPGVAPSETPSVRRLVFTVGSRCRSDEGPALVCDHFEAVVSDSFTVQPGDPGRALLERARARGGLPVIFFPGDAALPVQRHLDAPSVARLAGHPDVHGLSPAWQPPRFRRARTHPPDDGRRVVAALY